ncbi:MAG: GNAT family N-acetyltransferase [Planctomycetota bacterium]|jgi:N-acetylglutamate synthase-like GNAT family acetyltransferase
MKDLTISPANSPAEAQALDTFLWEILWKPLGLARDIRESYRLDGECLELVAKVNNHPISGLVANWTSPSEVELRHLAVKPELHHQGVGSRLVQTLIDIASQNNCTRIHTISRNTSTGFFKKLGFTPAPGQAPDHPAFKKHGITFEMMEYHC